LDKRDLKADCLYRLLMLFAVSNRWCGDT